MTATLDTLRRRAIEQWKAQHSGSQPCILVGTASCGRAAGALEALEVFRREARDRGLDWQIIEVGCLGLCYAEPIVCITKPPAPGICYENVDAQRAQELVQRYLLGDDPLPQYALGTVDDPSGDGQVDGIPRLFDTPFFKPQVRRTLGNCGFIDPGQIDHYLAVGGYQGIGKALAMSRDEVIDEVRRSGLLGRGGAGFPTWRKWLFCKEAPGEKKYVVCNGSEGDPGTFSNRLLLESDPHRVLEGMLIAAYAVGADEGYVYCPSEYSVALERLETALGQMHEYGLLGENILDSPFSFRLRIKVGAGAYICGEETALIECIEGKRGVPRMRPPFPPVSGLHNKPTVINNVETLACATLAVQNGAAWFAELGTAESKGTKTFCLSGNVTRPGVFEVPFGITLQQIVYDIGGGSADGTPLKAAQTGGPAGGCLPARLFDVVAQQQSLLAHGASLGSGGIIVLDEHTCMVDLARNTMDFAMRESCGRCAPCRLGNKQMFEILKDITEGRGTPEDVDLLVEIGEGVKLGALCGLGQGTAGPLLSTLRYFREEYEAHVRDRKCPAGVCQELVALPC